MGGVTRVCWFTSILISSSSFSFSFSSTFCSFSPACDWSVCSEFGECVCMMPAGRMEAWEEDWIWSDLHPRLRYLPPPAPDQHGQ